MKITVENCSSPGASFTKNTDAVIYGCYEWVTRYSNQSKKFIEFRKEVSKAKNFNDNNARNIYPLLKNAGFVNYEKGHLLTYADFFTNIGLAYAKAIETEVIIGDSDYDDVQKEKALKKLKKIKQELVFKGICNLLKCSECTYRNELKAVLEYLLNYKKINKVEFAYLLYILKNGSGNYISDVNNDIEKYRNNEIDIEVEIVVRNDLDIRKKTGSTQRKEDLTFLTSYSYFVALLDQAGLIHKEHKKNYVFIPDENIKMLKEILEVQNART